MTVSGSNVDIRNSIPRPPVLPQGYESVQLTLERVEPLAHKLGDFSTAQTGYVNVIPAQLALIAVALALHRHQIERMAGDHNLENLFIGIDRYASTDANWLSRQQEMLIVTPGSIVTPRSD